MFKADAALEPVAEAAEPDSVEEAVDSLSVELAVCEAPEPEPELVAEELAVELAELELEVASSTVLLPHWVSRQVVIPSRSLG